MNLSYVYLVFALFLILIGSCQKDKVQAERSIEGTWRVTEVTAQYGTYTNNTFAENNTVTESGELGTFIFTEEQVSYNFKIIDTLFNETNRWSLTYKRVNSGFIRVPTFTLNLETSLSFDVFFEDGTKNAEKNAEKMTLTQIPANGDQVLLVLSLVKE